MAAEVVNGTNRTSKAPGLVKLNGVIWPWMVTQDALDTLKDYDVWDDDVWVTTYPKAGTHWVLEIVNLILVDGYEDKINRSQQSHPVEFNINQPGRTLLKLSPPALQQYEAMKQWQRPRIIMTHLTEELMPTQIYQGKGKVVYVIRNPKDITVSNWNFVKPMTFDPRYEDWDYFVKVSLTEEMMFGSWFTHVLNFWKKHRHDKNFLFIKYEDMKQDTKGAVIQIADFIGKHLSDEAVDRVVESCSLDSMKKRFENRSLSATKEAASGNSPSSDQTKPAPDKKTVGPLSIIRKGVVGDWKSVFTVAQNEAFDAIYREKMVGSGLTVQFE